MYLKLAFNYCFDGYIAFIIFIPWHGILWNNTHKNIKLLHILVNIIFFSKKSGFKLKLKEKRKDCKVRKGWIIYLFYVMFWGDVYFKRQFHRFTHFKILKKH